MDGLGPCGLQASELDVKIRAAWFLAGMAALVPAWAQLTQWIRRPPFALV